MKDRPILFSGSMVRALLAGTKTQTRRVVKITSRTPGLAMCLEPQVGVARPLVAAELCPYGQPGDRLWVRETHSDARDAAAGRVLFRADGDSACRWTPAIHMKRATSRILLEVIGVRVERLQDISRGDAMAEGCPFPNMAQGADPRMWYAGLWEQINGTGSWAANPWVWAVEFKRATERNAP